MDANNRRRRGVSSAYQAHGCLGRKAKQYITCGSAWVSSLLITGALGLMVSTVTADDATSTHDQLQRMQEKIDALASSNEAMRDEIDQLRTEQEEQWLSEQRAEEIRGLVQDVLADSDTRTSLMGDGLMAGWKDHFFLASADGRFKLEIAGQMQARFLYNWRDAVTTPTGVTVTDSELYGFENSLTRLIFKGHVFGKDIQYHISARFNFDSGVRIQEGSTNFTELAERANQKAPPGLFLDSAWIRLRLADELSVRVGQFKLPFNREELVSLPHQLAAAPSLVNQRTALGYSQGIEMTYLSGPTKLSIAFANGVPMLEFDTTSGYAPQPATIPDANYNVAGRLELLLNGQWDQFRQFTSPVTNEFGMMLGMAGFYQQGETSENVPFDEVDEVYGATGDVSVDWGGASVFGAFTWEQGKGPVRGASVRNFTIGWVIQGGIYLTPKWEVFARYEGGYADIRDSDTNDRFPTNDLSILTVGVNNYIDGQDVRWTIDCGVSFAEVSPYWANNQSYVNAPTGWLSDDAGSGKPQVLLRTQFQLLF